MNLSESFVKQKNHQSYLDLPPPFFFVKNVAPPVITYFFGAKTPGSNQGGKHKAGRKTSCFFLFKTVATPSKMDSETHITHIDVFSH